VDARRLPPTRLVERFVGHAEIAELLRGFEGRKRRSFDSFDELRAFSEDEYQASSGMAISCLYVMV
jgi:hypothetical protein